MNTELLNENRGKGWINVSLKAPEWVKEYVCEYREAVLEKRQMKPNLLRAFIQGCEKRSQLSLATRGRRPALPAPLTAAQVRALAKRTGQSFQDILFGKSPKVNEDSWLRERLANYGALILKDAKRYNDDDLTDDDTDTWDWDDDDAEKKHRKAATAHRTLAHKQSDVFAALPQFRAADLHDAAAITRSAEATSRACAASRALRKKK
jgi:hypothetical protein